MTYLTKAQRMRLRKIVERGPVRRSEVSALEWRGFSQFVARNYMEIRRDKNDGLVAVITQRGRDVSLRMPSGPTLETAKTRSPILRGDVQPKAMHPLVRTLYDKIKASGMTFAEVTRRSKLSPTTLEAWFHHFRAPNVVKLEKALAVVGQKLIITKDRKAVDVQAPDPYVLKVKSKQRADTDEHV